jgi:hypothetical protein
MRRTPEQVRAIIKEKVIGKVRSCHTSTGHFYEFAGHEGVTASVTTKLILEKKHLIPWAIGLAIDFLEIPGNFERLNGPERENILKAAKMQHLDVRDNAGSIGHRAHAIIEDYERKWIETGIRPESILSFVPEGTPPPVIAACRSCEKAFDKYELTPVVCEILVGLPGVGAGTLDLIAMNKKGELELIDFKTSNQIAQEAYNMQVNAYRYFFEKMTGLKIKRSRIFKIDKTSDKFRVYNVENYKEGVKAFKAISYVYDWVHNDKEKCPEDKIIIKI